MFRYSSSLTSFQTPLTNSKKRVVMAGFTIDAGLKGGLAFFSSLPQFRKVKGMALLARSIARPSVIFIGHNTQYTSLAIYILKCKQFGRVSVEMIEIVYVINNSSSILD